MLNAMTLRVRVEDDSPSFFAVASRALGTRATTGGHRKTSSTVETTEMLAALAKFSSEPYVYEIMV
jgi:hypothetical protein